VVVEWDGDTASVIYIYIYIWCVRLGNITTTVPGERGERFRRGRSSEGLECRRAWREVKWKSANGERARITRDDYLSFR